MVITGVTALASIGAVSANAAPATGRQNLAGSQAPWATTSHRIGAASGAEKVTFRVYLPNKADAAAYA